MKKQGIDHDHDKELQAMLKPFNQEAVEEADERAGSLKNSG